MKSVVLGTVVLVLVSPAAAQSSKEYAAMSQRAWSAFECAALADATKKPGEHERLFKMGYEQGKAFMEAALSGKIEPFDISSTAPWGMTAIMHGPNVDFMLGRLWETTADHALKDVYESDGKPTPTELWELKAEQAFQNKNCSLL